MSSTSVSSLTLPGAELAVSPRAGAPVWTSRLWVALLVLCGALFLDGLDVSMVGIALPSIGAELGLPAPQLQWVVSGYVLGYGGLLLLGDRALGRRPPSGRDAGGRRV